MIKIKKRMSSGYIKESFVDRSEIFKGTAQKSLLKKLKSHSGRDRLGHLSSRHSGSGAKKMYRVITSLDKVGARSGVIKSIEYDPYRSAYIARVELEDKQTCYVLAQDKLKEGSKIKTVESEENLNTGDRTRLFNIPVGSQISDVELYPGNRARLVRSAGSSATLMAIEEDYALVKLPSGEQRKIHKNCYATIGQISNPEHSNIRYGKAGRKRLMGIRPTVRGKVMSPRAHPHGGGEGVNPIGLKYPKTPWGKHAMGKITRRNKKTNKFIVKKAKK